MKVYRKDFLSLAKFEYKLLSTFLEVTIQMVSKETICVVPSGSYEPLPATSMLKYTYLFCNIILLIVVAKVRTKPTEFSSSD